MGQANINKAKYIQPSRRKLNPIKICIICRKVTKSQYELCHRHYADLTNTSHKSRINIKKVIMFMKEINKEYSPKTSKTKEDKLKCQDADTNS